MIYLFACISRRFLQRSAWKFAGTVAHLGSYESAMYHGRNTSNSEFCSVTPVQTDISERSLSAIVRVSVSTDVYRPSRKLVAHKLGSTASQRIHT